MNLSPLSPCPKVEEMQRRLETELSLRTRVLYTLLLLVDLTLGTLIASLWITEPVLPTRTHIAFGLLMGISMTWAVVIGWTLTRRKVLLAGHRLTTSRLATLFTGLFTAGALLLALTTPAQRDLGLTAAAFGTALFAVAFFLWRRAAANYHRLLERVKDLESHLKDSATGFALLLTLCLGLVGLWFPAISQAQVLSPAPIEVAVPAGAPTPILSWGSTTWSTKFT